jgi:hypothetical protein
MVMKKNHIWKGMRFVFFFQTSNIHPIKQKYKSWKETLYFYYIKYFKNQKILKMEKKKKKKTWNKHKRKKVKTRKIIKKEWKKMKQGNGNIKK